MTPLEPLSSVTDFFGLFSFVGPHCPSGNKDKSSEGAKLNVVVFTGLVLLRVTMVISVI